MRKRKLMLRRLCSRTFLGFLCMAAGGGFSVLVSQAWDRPFYVGMSAATGIAEDKETDILDHVSELGNGFLENNQDDTALFGEVPAGIGTAQGDTLASYGNTDFSQRLNFAYYYDDGTVSQDVSQSYAGRVYQTLMKKDSSWMSGIYNLRLVTPEAMAARLGIDKSAVMGVRHLNGAVVDTDEAPQAIPSWNRFTVTFRNGDGTVVMGHSNIKEILSLASVYGYFHDEQSYDFLASYADKLWNDSHRYKISVSSVYYCQGQCLYSEESTSGVSAETEAPTAVSTDRNRAEDISGGGQEAESQQDSSSPSLQSDGGGTGEQDHQETQAPVRETADIYMRQNDFEPADVTILNMKNAEKAGTEARETDVTPLESDSPASDSSENAGEETGGSESREEGTEPDMAAGLADAPIEPAPESAALETADPETALEAAAGTEAFTAGETVKEQTVEAQTRAAAEESRNGSAERNKKASNHYCMGHIDLNISAVVLGMDENKGLFYYGEIPAGTADNERWNGWDAEAMACARSVAEQDWYAQYGLSSTESTYVQNPLSGSEVTSYMNLVADNTSQKRRHVVEQASVICGMHSLLLGRQTFWRRF